MKSPTKQQGQGGETPVIQTDDFKPASSFVEEELGKKLKTLGDYLEGDPITLIAPMRTPLDSIIRDELESIKDKKKKLVLVLETDGGQIEVVERIADVIRHHYPDEVSVIVPDYAMSAGTVLAMIGDNIYMDYFSVLGPVDPQVRSRTKGDAFVPALGYLAKYNELIEKSANGRLSAAEIAFLLDKFDPAELHQFEQARALSIELLKKWLVSYKFKNWTKTRDRGIAVTLEMKEHRAEEIAAKLNDTTKWKTHSRGLYRKVIPG